MFFWSGKSRLSTIENKSSDDGPQQVFDHRQALAEIDRASMDMAHTLDAPRGFFPAFIALISTAFALGNVITWPALLGICALGLPLWLWHHLAMRDRPKPRHPRRHSGRYVGTFLILILVLQLASYWSVETWREVALKWVALYGALWILLSGLRSLSRSERVKDAHEHVY